MPIDVPARAVAVVVVVVVVYLGERAARPRLCRRVVARRRYRGEGLCYWWRETDIKM